MRLSCELAAELVSEHELSWKLRLGQLHADTAELVQLRERSFWDVAAVPSWLQHVDSHSRHPASVLPEGMD